MNLMTLVSLIFDGTQVLVENIGMILVFSVQILGIGVLMFWGISARRAKEGTHRVAFLSLGLCGFILLSYAIVAISRIWHPALPMLAMGMLIVSSLGLIMGVLVFIKKKNVSAESSALSSQLLSLR